MQKLLSTCLVNIIIIIIIIIIILQLNPVQVGLFLGQTKGGSESTEQPQGLGLLMAVTLTEWGKNQLHMYVLQWG